MMRELLTEPDLLDVRFLSTEAFLAWENEQEMRHELIDGLVWAMPGGTRGHSIITSNLGSALHTAVSSTPCEQHGPEYRVRAPTGEIMYPDAWVRCGPLDDRATEAPDPVVVFEVLSPSTRTKDLVRKRRIYRSIPTLRHIGFVEPDRVHVEHLVRPDGGAWSAETLASLDEVMELTAIGVRLPLRSIYERVITG